MDKQERVSVRDHFKITDEEEEYIIDHFATLALGMFTIRCKEQVRQVISTALRYNSQPNDMGETTFMAGDTLHIKVGVDMNYELMYALLGECRLQKLGK